MTKAKTSLCKIITVGKRRDGGTKYWCVRHRADATAKYGVAASACRYAHVPEPRVEETYSLDVDAYPGGVGLWGAVPPIYDTTARPLDRGIHVHARRVAGGQKEIDATYLAVRVRTSSVEFAISDLDAIYFMVTSIFGLTMKEVRCTLCGFSHLDRDWFAVHAHASHLCAACGRTFRDDQRAVGNPIAGLRAALAIKSRTRRGSATRTLKISQRDYEGGIQIWGSNPAILWTSRHDEVDGVHVHAFRRAGDVNPEVDETYSRVVIDGIPLDATQVRVLMAQRSLPHLSGRVSSLRCEKCGAKAFAADARAFTPSVRHQCDHCGANTMARGRLRKVIANSLLDDLVRLANHAVRPPQEHDLGLIPETL